MNQCINTIILLFQGGNCINNDAPIQARNSSSFVGTKEGTKEVQSCKKTTYLRYL